MQSILIGERIKKIREEKDLSQADLANLIGCRQSTVAAWEIDKERLPSRKYLVNLSKALDIELEDLLGREGLKSPKMNYFGEIKSEEFIWPENAEINVKDNFSFKILDDYLEPIASKSDICIFEKGKPRNGDIVVVRYSKLNNKSVIRMWRQEEQQAMLSEISIKKITQPYFFEILDYDKWKFEYVIKKNNKEEILSVEGKLAIVKKNPKNIQSYSHISYKI